MGSCDMSVEERIACFGDSLTNIYFDVFKRRYVDAFPDTDASFLNAAVNGDTTDVALSRLDRVLEFAPTTVLVCFGMNDQALGPILYDKVPPKRFHGNLVKMIDAIESAGARVLLLTLNPLEGGFGTADNLSVSRYNGVIRDVCREKWVRLVDVHRLWLERVGDSDQGFEPDGFHPNSVGAVVYGDAIVRVIQRRSQIILWQYNGNPCACNYRCPYCQYAEQKGQHFQGPIEKWRDAFRRTFGNRHLVFYFGHGEPMVGKAWFDVVDMVGSEPNWEMRCISNISPSLDRLLDSAVAREGRLNINASFHPTETTFDKFLAKLLQCREAGIEVPVVYTMYPPFLERLERDVEEFAKHGFIVHVRRFRGMFEGRVYPAAYSDEDMIKLARYCDDVTIKYMLSMEPTNGKLSWTGADFCLIDGQGNVGYCDDYWPKEFSFGNIFEENVRLNLDAEPFPREPFVSDGTVDGVANICEIGYPQLEKNHILHFSGMGGVYRTKNGVHYENLDTDFHDRRNRCRLRMPVRNVSDACAILRYGEGGWRERMQRVASCAFPGEFTQLDEFSIRLFVARLLRRNGRPKELAYGVFGKPTDAENGR